MSYDISITYTTEPIKDFTQPTLTRLSLVKVDDRYLEINIKEFKSFTSPPQRITLKPTGGRRKNYTLVVGYSIDDKPTVAIIDFTEDDEYSIIFTSSPADATIPGKASVTTVKRGDVSYDVVMFAYQTATCGFLNINVPVRERSDGLVYGCFDFDSVVRTDLSLDPALPTTEHTLNFAKSYYMNEDGILVIGAPHLPDCGGVGVAVEVETGVWRINKYITNDCDIVRPGCRYGHYVTGAPNDHFLTLATVGEGFQFKLDSDLTVVQQSYFRANPYRNPIVDDYMIAVTSSGVMAVVEYESLLLVNIVSVAHMVGGVAKVGIIPPDAVNMCLSIFDCPTQRFEVYKKEVT